MLSRVLRGEDTGLIQPLSWRRAPGSSAPPMPTVPVAGKKVEYAQTADQQIGALQARIAELEALMERRVRETRDAAYKEGETAGKNQTAAQVQPVLDKLAKSIQELGEIRPKLRHDAEADLLKLALAIARKILHRELSADPDSIAGLVRVAVEKIRAQEILKVRIHPQHHPILQQILARVATGAQIDVFPDPKLELGGVVVETTRGEFDASVDLQLREIERGLADRLVRR
jgi:flagellar assembly protein FliH